MYNVSDAYLTAVNQHTRTDKIQVELLYPTMATHCILTDEDIEEGTLTISRQCVNNDYFEFGAAYASELQFQTKTRKITIMSIVGQYVRVTYSLRLADGTFEDVPCGIFRITECEFSKGLRKITAYDCLVTLDWDVKFSPISNTSPYNMLISALYGNESAYLAYGLPKIPVMLGNTKEEIEAMPNGTVPMSVSDDMQTAREYISSVAELLGCYVEADKIEANKIWLKRFRPDIVQTISSSIRFSYDVNINWDRPKDVSTKIQYKDNGSERTAYSYIAEGDGRFILTGSYRMMLDNKILNILGETNAKKVADNLAAELTRLNQMEYIPISFSFFGNPALDVGDMVECEYNGTHNPTLIGAYVWNYRNAESVTAISGNKATDISQSQSGLKNEPASSGTSSGGTDSMHYYAYTNTESVSIADGSEADIVSIRAVSYRATNIVFLAEIKLHVDTTEIVTEDTYTCTEGIISAAYYVGSVEIGASRPQWTLQDGVCTIHLIHNFSMTGYEAIEFHVKLFVRGCSIDIPAQCIQAVLEGTYLAGQEAWDGLISVSDTICVAIDTTAVCSSDITDETEVHAAEVMQRGFSDTIAVSVGSTDTTVTGFSDAVQSEVSEVEEST